MSSFKHNISDKTGLFSPKVKFEILSKIETLLTKGDRERLATWFFEEQALIKEDVQYAGFLELEKFLGTVIIQGLEEARVLRQEIHHVWKELGSTFRVFWHHSMNHAQREAFIISALMHTAATPNGDELRRYILDFDCAGLCANNGKALVIYIKGLADPDRREHNTPNLSEKLHRIFDDWQQANSTGDEIAEHKENYLSQLKHRCLFSRDIFGCRFVFRFLEMWQSFVAAYDPQAVANANPFGIKNNYDGTFCAVNAADPHTTNTRDGDDSKACSKKASKKKAKGRRGQKAKSEYQTRKKDNRERRARSLDSTENSCDPLASGSHIEQADDGSDLALIHPSSQGSEACDSAVVTNGSDLRLEPRPMSEITELEAPGFAGPIIDLESFAKSELRDINSPIVFEDDQTFPNIANSSSLMTGATDVPGVISLELSSPYFQEIPSVVQDQRDVVRLNIELREEKSDASDVPELLSDRATELCNLLVLEELRPKSPSTPIIGQSPAVQILSGDSYLEDAFSLVNSASAQSDMDAPAFKTNEFSISETDHPCLFVENHTSVEQMLPIVDPDHNLAGLNIPRIGQQFETSPEGVVPYDSEPPVEIVTAGIVTMRRARNVYIAIPNHLFQKKSIYINNMEDGPIILPDFPTKSSKNKKCPDQGQQRVEISLSLPQETGQNALGNPATFDETTSIPECIDFGVPLDKPAQLPEGLLAAFGDNSTQPDLSDSHKSLVVQVNETSIFIPSSREASTEPPKSSEISQGLTISTYDEKEIPVDCPYSQESSAESISGSVSIASELSGPTISEDGLFIEDPNVQGDGLKEKGAAFVGKVTQLLEDSCSQISSRRNSTQAATLQTQAEQFDITHQCISDDSSRRNSQDSSGSLEDQVRYMLMNSQKSRKPQAAPQTLVHVGNDNYQNGFVSPSPYPQQPPPFLNGSEFLPCHQAVFHHAPSIGESYGYFGSSRISEELKASVTRVPIGSIIFECNTCNGPLTDENSIICPMCGVNSHTRFCNENCRYAGGFHWKCCGINGLQYETDHHPLHYMGPLRSTGNMNAYRFWHPTILHDYPGFDFLVFDGGLVNNESPRILRAIIFNEQPLRDRFHAVYKRAIWDFDEFCVRLVWRVVRAWLKVCWWTDITVEHLSRQFELEFGHGWLNVKNGDLPEDFPSEEEWLKVEQYLDRKLEWEGYTNTKAVSTKLPLVWKEPRLPQHIAERVAPGGATPTGLHVWY